MSKRQLAVWLYGTHIADLTEPHTYRYRLAFHPDALDRWGIGARLLSLNLPISDRPITDSADARPVAAFLEGLLPEGNLRRQIASALGVPVIDSMALLDAVGRECAGAVQFLAPSEEPSEGHVRPLREDEVTELVEALPTYDTPGDEPLQASLAGLQDKILLTRLGEQWGWPSGGAASTHLIKPEPRPGTALPAHLVELEHWALTVAASAGLSAAVSELRTFGQRAAIVVQRYDRTSDGTRLHQEDLCQALGLDPDAKYESTTEAETRGSRLSRVVRLAQRHTVDPATFRAQLLRTVTFNIAIGNADAHSKNYSVLIGAQGQLSLAPLYDAAPLHHMARLYANVGQVIGGRGRIAQVGIDELVAEAATWGMNTVEAERIVTSTMASTRDAAHDVPLPPGCDDVLLQLDEYWQQKGWPGTAPAGHS